MIGIIFSECWTNDNNKVKKLIVFFFNQLKNKMGLSTPRLTNEYSCVWFFNIPRHLFDAVLSVN